MLKYWTFALLISGLPVAFAAEGDGGPQFGGLLQVWNASDIGVSSGNATTRIRRVELKVSGSLLPKIDYLMMADAAKTLNAASDNKILQDVRIGINWESGWALWMGQFKTPTTVEGLKSSGALWFPERAMVARTFGDQRQTGVQLRHAGGPVRGFLMFSNGAPTNANDTNYTKDLAARVEALPIEELTLGAFTSAVDSNWNTAGRYGLSVGYEGEVMGLLAEWARGAQAGDGWSVAVYRAFGAKWRAAVRIEALRTSARVTGERIELAMHHRILEDLLSFQFAVAHMKDLVSSNGAASTTPSAGKGSAGQATLALQVQI
jgi:hypothetical protein